MENLMWTTNNGKRLRVTEMQTSHIRNAKRMLERAEYVPRTLTGGHIQIVNDPYAPHEAVEQWIEIFDNELRSRKDPSHD